MTLREVLWHVHSLVHMLSFYCPKYGERGLHQFVVCDMHVVHMLCASFKSND